MSNVLPILEGSAVLSTFSIKAGKPYVYDPSCMDVDCIPYLASKSEYTIRFNTSGSKSTVDCRLHCNTSILVFPANVLVASLTARLCKIRRRPVLPNELIDPETHLLH